jgi:hypothetical protein
MSRGHRSALHLSIIIFALTIIGCSDDTSVSGADDTSGSSGSSGTSGADGSSGADGTSGTNGTSGADGTSGSSGADGTSGSSGADGTSGSSGADGTSGSSGADDTSGSSGSSGEAVNPGGFNAGGAYYTGRAPEQPAPALSPRLLLVTYLGGEGDQFIREVDIDAQGLVSAQGDGFRLTYDPSQDVAQVTGDVSTPDAAAYSERPDLFKEWNNTWDANKNAKIVNDSRHDLTYYMGTMQVHPDLQQPLLLTCPSNTPCDRNNDLGNLTAQLWGWWGSLAFAKSLAADSRGYDVWLMPDGLIGAQAWTDGGNSTIGRDPRRRAEEPCSNDACPTLDRTLESLVSAGTWQPMPGQGPLSLYMVIDPVTAQPVRATFVRRHVTRITHDAWGRLYIPQAVSKQFPTVDPDNTFGHSDAASSGLFVLDLDMGAALNVRLGGTPCAGGTQVLGRVALRDNILVLGGTTCAPDLVTTANAPQATYGAGQDGMVMVIQLW